MSASKPDTIQATDSPGLTNVDENGDASTSRHAVGGTQAIDRALLLLRLVGEADGPVSLNTLCKQSGLNRTTAWRLLGALEKNRFLCRDPLTRDYDLGTAMSCLCTSPQRRHATLVQLCMPEMKALRERFQESIFLGVPCSEGSITVCQLDPPRSVRLRDYTNQVTPLWGTSTGKALMAYFSDDTLKVMLDQSLTAYTRDTITNSSILFKEIQEVRRLGYALVEGEWSLEENAISCAMAVNDKPVAVLGIGGPRSRLTRKTMEDEMAPLLMAACRRLEKKLV